ncbi:MAG: hypothetical protein AVDCRST_MAG49-4171, partial [uncultured Thermomicrobiales bacterium]
WAMWGTADSGRGWRRRCGAGTSPRPTWRGPSASPTPRFPAGGAGRSSRRSATSSAWRTPWPCPAPTSTASPATPSPTRRAWRPTFLTPRPRPSSRPTRPGSGGSSSGTSHASSGPPTPSPARRSRPAWSARTPGPLTTPWGRAPRARAPRARPRSGSRPGPGGNPMSPNPRRGTERGGRALTGRRGGERR